MALFFRGAASRRAIISAVAIATIWITRIFWDFSIGINDIGRIVKWPSAQSEAIAPFENVHDRVAMILDTKFTDHLAPLVMHFKDVLGPEWPIVFFTSEETSTKYLEHNMTLPEDWQRAVGDKNLHVATIPNGIDLTSRDAVNAFMSQTWLWERLAPAKHVLVFQADSIVCSDSSHKIDDFLKYDFIGAPWGPETLLNGGLSLRNRDMVMEIIHNRNYGDDMGARQRGPAKDTSTGEDVWFVSSMRGMDGTLPTMEVARQFAVQWEPGWYERPLGYHKVHKTMPKRLGEIREWCPEIDLAVPNYLKGEEEIH